MTKTATAICALIGVAVIDALLGFTRLPDPAGGGFSQPGDDRPPDGLPRLADR